MEMCFIHLRIVISTLLCRCAVNAEGMLVVDTRLQENHHKIQFTLRHHTRVVAPEFPTKNTSDTLEPLHSNSKKMHIRRFRLLVNLFHVAQSTIHTAHINIVFFYLCCSFNVSYCSCQHCLFSLQRLTYMYVLCSKYVRFSLPSPWAS